MKLIPFILLLAANYLRRAWRRGKHCFPPWQRVRWGRYEMCGITWNTNRIPYLRGVETCNTITDSGAHRLLFSAAHGQVQGLNAQNQRSCFSFTFFSSFIASLRKPSSSSALSVCSSARAQPPDRAGSDWPTRRLARRHGGLVIQCGRSRAQMGSRSGAPR